MPNWTVRNKDKQNDSQLKKRFRGKGKNGSCILQIERKTQTRTLPENKTQVDIISSKPKKQKANENVWM